MEKQKAVRFLSDERKELMEEDGEIVGVGLCNDSNTFLIQRVRQED